MVIIFINFLLNQFSHINNFEFLKVLLSPHFPFEFIVFLFINLILFSNNFFLFLQIICLIFSFLHQIQIILNCKGISVLLVPIYLAREFFFEKLFLLSILDHKILRYVFFLYPIFFSIKFKIIFLFYLNPLLILPRITISIFLLQYFLNFQTYLQHLFLQLYFSLINLFLIKIHF